MKQKTLLLALLFVANIAHAQQLYKGESALIYHMPKTNLAFQLHIEKTIEQPGIFYLYAEKYLGATDIITTTKEFYTLKGVDMKTTTDVDVSRTYTIPLSDKTTASYIINKKGLLCSINSPFSTTTPKHSKKTSHTTKIEKKTTELMPLNEEQMRANSIGKMAEEVAQQIYRIRENRLMMLSGDIEQMPQDGDALKTMLKQLQKEEQRLCELFVGTRTVVSYQEVITHCPYERLDNYILFRFSAQQGVVADDDLSGEPIYLNIKPTIQNYIPDTKKSKKKQVETSIYYNQPGTATISINSTHKLLLEKYIQVPQFGISIPLPMSLFEKQGYKAIFDPKTGNLLELTKQTK